MDAFWTKSMILNWFFLSDLPATSLYGDLTSLFIIYIVTSQLLDRMANLTVSLYFSATSQLPTVWLT